MGCPADGCTGYELADGTWTLTPTATVRPTPATPTGTTAPVGTQSVTLMMVACGLRLTADGYAIANLYINRPGNNGVGLFGTSSGTISNVELNAVQVHRQP